ncbi:MAG: hypothetical protein WCV62_03300 [Candidatus Peribacteraceae bacterium]|jgi:hypothetical protein
MHILAPELSYMYGKYVEPQPGSERKVARTLMGEFLKGRVRKIERQRRIIGFIRTRIGDVLHAFRFPTGDTITQMSDIGCTDVYPNGNAVFKVWIHCPEDIGESQRAHTIVLREVLLHSKHVRVRMKND